MILQSKMNTDSTALKSNDNIKKAKVFILGNTELGVWHSTDKLPSSIIGEIIHLWNTGELKELGRNIEFDEADQFYRVVNVKERKMTTILNKETGIYYNGFEEARLSMSKKYSAIHFWRMVNGGNKNITNFEVV